MNFYTFSYQYLPKLDNTSLWDHISPTPISVNLMCSAHFSDYMYVPVYLVFLTSVTSWITPILSLYLKMSGQGRLMSEAATAMGDRGSSLHWVSVEAFLAHTKGYRGSTAILL